jgi:hypothetical protein
VPCSGYLVRSKACEGVRIKSSPRLAKPEHSARNAAMRLVCSTERQEHPVDARRYLGTAEQTLPDRTQVTSRGFEGSGSL